MNNIYIYYVYIYIYIYVCIYIYIYIHIVERLGGGWPGIGAAIVYLLSRYVIVCARTLAPPTLEQTGTGNARLPFS